MTEISRILLAIERGDAGAMDELLPLVYGELRQLASRRLASERLGQTLEPTALVHEAYLRLLGADGALHFQNRAHFFGAAAEAMRRILVENARRKSREKHGGGRRRDHADLDQIGVQGTPEEILALHDALVRFAELDPVKAKLVELKFFGGMTLDEAAECLGISPSAADRSWRYARAWLYAAMDDGESSVS